MVPFATLAEKYGNFLNPRFEVTVGSGEITSSDGRITGLSIDTALGRRNRVSFTLNDVFDHGAGAFEDVDWERFSQGTALDVSVTYGDVEPTKLFKGTISSVQPNFPSGSAPSVSVSAKDLRGKMMSGSSSESWDESKLSDVASSIAGEYDFDDTTIAGKDGTLSKKKDLELKKLIKNADSDYKFLSGLASAFGFELFSRGGHFHFREPKTDASPVTTLTYGESLHSFRPGQPPGDRNVGKVKVIHRDEKTAEKIVGTAEREGGEDTDERRIPVESEEEANQRAEAILEDLTRGSSSEAETVGVPDLQIGKTVEIGGIDRFEGLYYVEEATHRIDRSGYTTTLSVTETEESA